MFWTSHLKQRQQSLLPDNSGNDFSASLQSASIVYGTSYEDGRSSALGVNCKLRTDSFVHDVYAVGEGSVNKLGEGAFSEVMRARHIATGVEVACKKIQLPPSTDPNFTFLSQEIFKEIDILCSLEHENLLKLIEYFVQGNQIYLFTELVPGGDLTKILHELESLPEETAKVIFVQLLRGIKHMHERNIAHRDLKLENILVGSDVPGDFSQIKIVDFGLAKHVDNRGYLTTVCGSPQYVAPEVLQIHPGAGSSVYGPKVDMWGAGVVLYLLLAGYPPFDGEAHHELFAQVMEGRFSFDMPVWDSVSPEAKDLICHLLVLDPEQRYTAAQALAHPWLRGAELGPGPAAGSGRPGKQRWPSRLKSAVGRPLSRMASSFNRKVG
uniref:Meiosis-specific serine/threonine-protein kinase MEK1 n=1 Tax=Tetraselmis sp. GSL018 TaxID=582737 RepID=A0A061RYX8_9CHLO|mmetsp:Transcript_33356/g.79084  ORF Transcript_33356/g.79084 Transcript_33356/m.79084 type:complete len:381 (-) Transcript_33356:127-1269(-)